jgi:hypothetical protein
MDADVPAFIMLFDVLSSILDGESASEGAADLPERQNPLVNHCVKCD